MGFNILVETEEGYCPVCREETEFKIYEGTHAYPPVYWYKFRCQTCGYDFINGETRGGREIKNLERRDSVHNRENTKGEQLCINEIIE